MKINIELESLEELKSLTELILVGDLETPHETKTIPAVIPAAPEELTPVSQPVAASAPVAAHTPAAVPTASTSYTMDDLARAGMTLMDSGRQADLQQLLSQFGVEALPALPKEQYGAFATALRGLGAQI